ncbi:hypothetical protein PHYPO_G00192280 [Pangasianodon hypophthalmus]|uniref:Plac8 onzin related protein 2 n=2 Tax=Pangasianodon hypophthalmus TaxID=310915 RepID=A0A5N5PJG6_PANHP|nr:hypothetical protein PHYPO_G00192280 [Pangasianodon hypophthalmus]
MTKSKQIQLYTRHLYNTLAELAKPVAQTLRRECSHYLVIALVSKSSQFLSVSISRTDPAALHTGIMAQMVVQQPSPVVVVNTTHSNQWSSGICDCCDNLADCCFAFWCFPCFACNTASNFGECLCLPMLDYGPIPPITLAMRASMRERYGIQGSICNDCIYSFFCLPCVWCQMSREMRARKQSVTVINARAR